MRIVDLQRYGPSGRCTIEAAFRYKPFGEPATPLVMPSTDPRFRYASQDLSSATKLYHMGARYYAPDLGRFVGRDPVGSHGYAYARDDPLAFRDPSGMDSQGFDWAGFGAFLAGAAVMGACIALTAGVCGGVLFAVALSAVAGAAAATLITAAQGKPITLAAVAGGALMGAFGGGFVFGFAGAGAFGEAAAQSALGVSASLSAGEGLGAGVAGTVGEEEGAAEDLGADVPTRGTPPGVTPTGMADGGTQTALQGEVSVGKTLSLGGLGEHPGAVILNPSPPGASEVLEESEGVVRGVGQQMPFQTGSFQNVLARNFPSTELPGSAPEVYRVLEPGGMFAGNTGTLLTPGELSGQLYSAGFSQVSWYVDDYGRLSWIAYK